MFEILRKCELKEENQKNREDFFCVLKELITILFAVVLGVGLTKLSDYHLNDFFIKPDFWYFILANLAVVFSWWGYNWGSIKGPKEINWLCYIIDYALIIIYWCLLNKTENLIFILACYVLMFFLYLIWECIRLSNPEKYKGKIKNAVRTNFVFTLFFLVLLLFKLVHGGALNILDNHIFYVGIILVSLVVYRICIHKAYIDNAVNHIIKKSNEEMVNTLVLKAKEAALNAKPKLSNFKVGAAILSKENNIFHGCNFEFDNYSNTIHAEESALSAMITNGDIKPVMIAVYTDTKELNYPCGMCRQSLFELGGAELKVIACNNTNYEIKKMSELMPNAFIL